jgi:hypothetical protein
VRVQIMSARSNQRAKIAHAVIDFQHRGFKDLKLQTSANAHFDSKRLSGGLATWNRPRNPKSGSAGDAGTATGTDIQTVQRRTSPNHPKIGTRASPTRPVRPVSPLLILIRPTASGRKWIARLGDRVLCVSAWPFVKSARLLLTESWAADTVIEMWRPGTHEWAMRGRVGAVAAMIIDGEATSRCAKNGSPARNLDRVRGKGLPLICARPRVVSRGGR